MSEEMRIAIGERIEKVRVENLRNMSRVKLGKAIGTTGQNIGLVISGKNNLSLGKAIELCNYANVSMDYIFRGIEPVKEEDNFPYYRRPW